MPQNQDSFTAQATLVNALGLHARSAIKIARVAQRAGAGVQVAYGKTAADATSVIDILTLACPAGETLKFTIEAPEDYDILQALVDLVNDGFGELPE